MLPPEQNNWRILIPFDVREGISLAIAAAEGNEPFTVRFQTKALEDGVVTWTDAEVVQEVGKSQIYGIDENFRLIVEAGPLSDAIAVTSRP